jgi:exopolysaccharide production protein ExoZ
MEHRTKFAGIEAGRGIAAVLVVFHHAGSMIAEPRFYNATMWDGHFANFNVGVDFFFVLSGFIIAWVHWSDIGQPGRLTRYAVRRFLRIYPPYWGILIPLAALYFLFPAAGRPHQHDPVNLFFSLTLLPNPAPPILGVAWTLVHEMLFYTIFGGIIALGKRAIWALPAWGVAILAAQITAPLPFPASILLSAFNLEFLLGITAALWLRSHPIPFPGWLAAVGTLSFLALMLLATRIQDIALIGRLAFGFSATAAIVGLVELERTNRLKVPSPLLFLGAASYAIYLIHVVVLSATIHLLVRLTPKTAPIALIFVCLVVAGIIGGLIYHRLIEQPLARAFRGWVPTPRRACSSPPPTKLPDKPSPAV